jgi:hypothetical protein
MCYESVRLIKDRSVSEFSAKPCTRHGICIYSSSSHEIWELVGLRGTVLYIVVAIGTHEARLNPKSLICGKQADMTHEAGAV